MQTDPAVLIGIFAVLAAIIGPIAGVIMADRYARSQEARREGYLLISKLIDLQTKFAGSIVATYAYRLAISRPQPMTGVPENERLQELYRLERAKMEESEATLMGYGLLLSVVFGKRASPVSIAINELTKLSALTALNYTPLLPLSEVQILSYTAVQNVTKTLLPLLKMIRFEFAIENEDC